MSITQLERNSDVLKFIMNRIPGNLTKEEKKQKAEKIYDGVLYRNYQITGEYKIPTDKKTLNDYINRALIFEDIIKNEDYRKQGIFPVDEFAYERAGLSPSSSPPDFDKYYYLAVPEGTVPTGQFNLPEGSEKIGQFKATDTLQAYLKEAFNYFITGSKPKEKFPYKMGNYELIRIPKKIEDVGKQTINQPAVQEKKSSFPTLAPQVELPEEYKRLRMSMIMGKEPNIVFQTYKPTDVVGSIGASILKGLTEGGLNYLGKKMSQEMGKREFDKNIAPEAEQTYGARFRSQVPEYEQDKNKYEQIQQQLSQQPEPQKPTAPIQPTISSPEAQEAYQQQLQEYNKQLQNYQQYLDLKSQKEALESKWADQQYQYTSQGLTPEHKETTELEQAILDLKRRYEHEGIWDRAGAQAYVQKQLQSGAMSSDIAQGLLQLLGNKK